MPRRFTNLEFEAPREEERAKPRSQTEAELQGSLVARARDAEGWGRFEEALRLYTRALGENRALIPAWVGQVQMLVQLDECHEARVWAGKALQLFRQHGDLLAADAQAAARLRDLKTARQLTDAAMQAGGDTPWRWIARGDVLLARGARLATSCFEKAVQHAAAVWLDYVTVGRVCQYYRRYAAALQYIKQALVQQPEHGYPWLLMGECQYALGMAGPARDSIGRAAELAPEWAAPRAALQAMERGGGWWSWGRRLRRVVFWWR